MTALRPHHALCLRFFIGEGYSEHFVRHMTEVKERLQRENPPVTLTDSCDLICAGCPHNSGGVCTTDDKVAAIDRRTAELLGLRFGDTVPWRELYVKANAEIIGRGRLREVCRDCCWIHLCDK